MLDNIRAYFASKIISADKILGYETFRYEAIETLAKDIADKQRKADEHYYRDPVTPNEDETASYYVELAEHGLAIADKLHIRHEVYSRAIEIYDFRNSGREGYHLVDGRIVDVEN